MFTNMDFKPHNIMVMKTSITVFDWEKTNSEWPIFWMLSNFIRSLDNLKFKTFSNTILIEKQIKLIENFYFKESIFSSHYKYYNLIKALDMLLSLSDESSHYSNKNELPRLGAKNKHYFKMINLLLDI